MKFKKFLVIASTCVLLILPLLGCSQEKSELKEIATVTRGTIQASPVTADGNLSMPKEARLNFGAGVKVSKVYVKKGEQVKAGKLLAKADDADIQELIKQTVYDIESALNPLAEKVYPSLLGYPNYYPSASSRLRVEQAQRELTEAIELSAKHDYAGLASKLRLINHDLSAGLQTLQEAELYIKNYPEKVKDNVGDPENWVQYYPAIRAAVDNMQNALDTVSGIQQLGEKASF